MASTGNVEYRQLECNVMNEALGTRARAQTACCRTIVVGLSAFGLCAFVSIAFPSSLLREGVASLTNVNKVHLQQLHAVQHIKPAQFQQPVVSARFRQPWIWQNVQPSSVRPFLRQDVPKAHVDVVEAAVAAPLVQPKKPPSAYMIWLGENRAKLAEEAGTKAVAEVAKLAGEQWGKLTPEQKVDYEKLAAAEKEQYNKAIEEFKAAGGEMASRKPKKEKKLKKVKDANKPKKPPSAYMLWLADNRESFYEELGKKDVTSVAKLAGERWKDVTPKAKAPYEEKAQKKKEEHKVAMEAYEVKAQKEKEEDNVAMD